MSLKNSDYCKIIRYQLCIGFGSKKVQKKSHYLKVIEKTNKIKLEDIFILMYAQIVNLTAI